MGTTWGRAPSLNASGHGFEFGGAEPKLLN